MPNGPREVRAVGRKGGAPLIPWGRQGVRPLVSGFTTGHGAGVTCVVLVSATTGSAVLDRSTAELISVERGATESETLAVMCSVAAGPGTVRPSVTTTS